MKIIGFGLDPKTVYSTKYRLEKYKDFFSKNGIYLDIKPTFQISSFEKIYKKSKILGNFSYYGIHLFNVIVNIISSSTYDAVFVQRHLFPGKISYLEKLLVFCNKNIIFDFDDAIFTIPKHFRYKNWKSDPNAKKEFDKVVYLIKHSKLVIAGNTYLANYAKKYNKNTIIIPTPIDTDVFSNPKKEYHLHKPIRLGWYGSWGNQPYLETIMPAINKLLKKYYLKLIVISDKAYFKNYDFIENVKWNEDIEEKQLTNLDISIAPLPIDNWTRGKCGYKILKYMICGLPSVVSPIEIQKEIIDHGVNGYHASSIGDWYTYIEKLIKDEKLRKEFGIKSISKITKQYSRVYLGSTLIKEIKKLFLSKVRK